MWDIFEPILLGEDIMHKIINQSSNHFTAFAFIKYDIDSTYNKSQYSHSKVCENRSTVLVSNARVGNDK
jgi:hypothetical protein